MMTLLEMAQNTLARLAKIETARDGVNEARALESLLSELNELALPLNQLAANAKLLRTEGVSLSPITETTTTIDKVNDVATRFSELPKSTTLKQGRQWTGLTKKLEGLMTQVKNTQSKDWSTYFKDLVSVLPPEQRRATLALTPENTKLFERYKELYGKFIGYRTQIPNDANEIMSLRALAKQLAEIKFQENVPPDVRKFFEATSTGADLSLVTNKVIDWLRSNKLLDNYVVRPKIN